MDLLASSEKSLQGLLCCFSYFLSRHPVRSKKMLNFMIDFVFTLTCCIICDNVLSSRIYFLLLLLALFWSKATENKNRLIKNTEELIDQGPVNTGLGWIYKYHAIDLSVVAIRIRHEKRQNSVYCTGCMNIFIVSKSIIMNYIVF